MTWVAVRSLMERRTRAALTALAVVLGVAMIAGSLILTDSIDRAFTSIFSSSYTNTDLVVRGTPVVQDSFSGAPPVPESALPRIMALLGVEAAAGNLVDLSGSGNNVAKLVDRDRSAMCCVKEYLLAALRLDAASSARLAANAISVVLSSQAKH